MKKLLIASAVLGAFTLTAQAADVSIYGVLDYSIGYYDYKVDGQSSVKNVQMDTGRWMGPRVGLKGGEDLGGGTKLSFVLETGFNGDDGTLGQGGLFFGREAQLSLETAYGTFAFGRMGNLASGNGTYCLGGKEMSPFVAAMGIAGHNNYLFGNERYDNMLTYRSPTFSGVTLSAQHSLNTSGTESAGAGNNNRYSGIGVSWRGSATYAALVVEHYRYSNAVNNEQDNAATCTLVANHQFGPAKVFGTFQYMDAVPYLGMPDAVNAQGRIGKGSTTGITSNDGLTGYAGSVGLGYAIGGGTAKASVGYFDVDDDGKDYSYKRTILGLGYLYPLSKRTGVYAQVNYGKTEREGGTMKDVEHRQAFAGMFHRF